jgi:hypothetical protein
VGHYDLHRVGLFSSLTRAKAYPANVLLFPLPTDSARRYGLDHATPWPSEPTLSDSSELDMKTRLAGLGLICIGVLFAVFFVYFPVRDGPSGFMGTVSPKALVFIPLAIVTGLSFVLGGAPVLEAFQARPKSKEQLTLVLSIIIGSGVLTGLGYWQLKTRWMRAPEPVILDASPRVPQLPPNNR